MVDTALSKNDVERQIEWLVEAVSENSIYDHVSPAWSWVAPMCVAFAANLHDDVLAKETSRATPEPCAHPLAADSALAYLADAVEWLEWLYKHCTWTEVRGVERSATSAEAKSWTRICRVDQPLECILRHFGRATLCALIRVYQEDKTLAETARRAAEAAVAVLAEEAARAAAALAAAEAVIARRAALERQRIEDAQNAPSDDDEPPTVIVESDSDDDVVLLQ